VRVGQGKGPKRTGNAKPAKRFKPRPQLSDRAALCMGGVADLWRCLEGDSQRNMALAKVWQQPFFKRLAGLRRKRVLVLRGKGFRAFRLPVRRVVK
jgi:hypothetical protein